MENSKLGIFANLYNKLRKKGIMLDSEFHCFSVTNYISKYEYTIFLLDVINLKGGEAETFDSVVHSSNATEAKASAGQSQELDLGLPTWRAGTQMPESAS